MPVVQEAVQYIIQVIRNSVSRARDISRRCVPNAEEIYSLEYASPEITGGSRGSIDPVVVAVVVVVVVVVVVAALVSLIMQTLFLGTRTFKNLKGLRRSICRAALRSDAPLTSILWIIFATGILSLSIYNIYNAV